jgi:hypothetical protein
MKEFRYGTFVIRMIEPADLFSNWIAEIYRDGVAHGWVEAATEDRAETQARQRIDLITSKPR